jgi:hypothetical protein
MTFFQFRHLPLDEQTLITWDKGVHLTTRFHGLHAILLWQIDGFYVEIFYNRVDHNIDKLRSFRSTIPLRPYLNEIDITSVLQ